MATALRALVLAAQRFAAPLRPSARRHRPALVRYAHKQRSNVNRKKLILPRFVRFSHPLELLDLAKARPAYIIILSARTFIKALVDSKNPSTE